MIKKIVPSEISNAEKIHALFQVSYRIEAELLGVTDFPPLQRSIIDFQNSITQYFREGIAQKLLLFLENYDDSKTLIVETGWANVPAIALYKKFGFHETSQYINTGGIKKTCFSKTK